jgi:MOSC domain-containing protein YiiM
MWRTSYHVRMSTPVIVAVNISPGGIPKTPLEVVEVTSEGIRGDGHNHDKHNSPMQAICLIDEEDLDDLRGEGFDVHPGATGENVTLRGVSVDDLAIGDRLRFAGGVEVEITRVRNPCYVLDAIDPTLKKAIRGRCGMYAKVIEGGKLRAGESVEIRRTVSAMREA